MVLSLLVVTVLGVGGPRAAASHGLPGATVRVTENDARGPLRIARTDASGKVGLKLKSGVYRVQALLTSPKAVPAVPRTTKVVRISRDGQGVSLLCSIR
jgi:hypothetical protein